MQIKNYGTKFDVRRTNVHRYTNIFIHESNPFYPYETLPVYCVSPLWFAAVGFLCSMGGAANLTAAIIGLIFDVPFLATYCEGSVRVCGDAVLRYFWCGFAVIFILTCGIAVSKH